VNEARWRRAAAKFVSMQDFRSSKDKVLMGAEREHDHHREERRYRLPRGGSRPFAALVRTRTRSTR
jgi:hypothetical protein